MSMPPPACGMGIGVGIGMGIGVGRSPFHHPPKFVSERPASSHTAGSAARREARSRVDRLGITKVGLLNGKGSRQQNGSRHDCSSV